MALYAIRCEGKINVKQKDGTYKEETCGAICGGIISKNGDIQYACSTKGCNWTKIVKA
jgi:hypothetical protein